MLPITTLAILFIALTTATPSPPLLKRNSQAVATFNDFKGQGAVDCPKLNGASFTSSPFGAASGDLSPDFSTNPTAGCGPVPSNLAQVCASGKLPPAPTCYNKVGTHCGKCYTVTNSGGALNSGQWLSKPVPATQGKVTVEIIDTCPHNHPMNYCKTNVPDNQKCSAPGTNALDIDQHAYKLLTVTKDFPQGIDYVAAYAAYMADKTKPLPPNLMVSWATGSC